MGGVDCTSVAGQVECAVVESVEGCWSHFVGSKVAGLDVEAGRRGPSGL